MSSSRPSSRPRKGDCPTCGSGPVVPVTEDVILRIAGRRHRVEAVLHERCAACGERIFDLEASRRFDAAILPRAQAETKTVKRSALRARSALAAAAHLVRPDA